MSFIFGSTSAARSLPVADRRRDAPLRRIGACVVSIMIGVVIAIAGCASTDVRPLAPKVRMERMQLLHFSPTDVRVRFALSVDNPNALPLAVKSLDATIAFDDLPFGVAKTVGPLTIAPGPGNAVDVDFRTDLAAVMVVAEQLSKRSTVRYELTGSAVMESGLRLSFYHRGEVPIPSLPTVSPWR